MNEENKGKVTNVLFEVFKPLAGVLVGVLLTYYLKKDQEEIIPVQSDLKEIQIVHDTVFVKS